MGREVKVKTRVPVDGAKNHRGVLARADDRGFTIDDGRRNERSIAYDDVASARTVFRVGRQSRAKHW